MINPKSLKRRRPPGVAAAVNILEAVDSDTAKLQSVTTSEHGGGNSNGSSVSLRSLREALPIASYRRQVVDAVAAHDAVILVGETGSGKTTQLPQFLWDAGLVGHANGTGELRGSTFGGGAATPAATVDGGKGGRVVGPSRRPLQIVITQPRRVAAITVARRVAAEMGTSVGGDRGLVGYSVRFDDSCGPATRIKFVTDGMLLRCVK